MGRERTASQRGKWSRNKGAAYEREVATLLRRIWPAARRGIGQSRAAGEVPDVDGTAYWIEAKAHRHVQIRKAYEQGLAATDGRDVVVISRDTGKSDLVTMPMTVFVAMLEIAQAAARAPSPPSPPPAAVMDATSLTLTRWPRAGD